MPLLIDRPSGSAAHLAVLGHPVVEMTSRTTSVGVVVLALAGVFAVGCTAQTSVVFQTLLDSASAPASPSGPDVDVADDLGDPKWWPHSDGYTMRLPGGWSGVSLMPAQADQLLGALASDYPELAGRVGAVLDGTGSDLSMVAADMAGDVDVPPVVLVISQPTDGRKARHVKARTYEQIAALPGLRGTIIRDDERLPNDVAHRYDYVVDDADLGAMRVRTYLFRLGHQAYLVSLIASEDAFEASEGTFDAIVESIRFGV